MKRIPLRARLTLGYAAALAALLVLVGALLYVRVASSLDEQVDDGLEARASALATLVRERGGRPEPAELAIDDGFAQVLREDGTVVASSLVDAPVVSRDDLQRARGSDLLVRRDDARLLLRHLEPQLFLVVGTSLGDRDAALASLLAQMLVVGTLALGAAGIGGYLLALAAARPVLERLEAGLARERRFVAEASHELRTPLATLQTELELALRRPRAPHELEQALRSASEEVERLVRLAEDLLVLARSDEGRLPLRSESLAARELVEAVDRRFAARASAAGRRLEVAADDSRILGDRLRLEQALGNLVDNALRHGAGTIRLEALRSDGRMELRVRDEGDGFPATLLDRVFERFARADGARSGGGAGLGLAIVDAIARAHGGTAHAENDRAGGAVVSIALPVSRA